MTLLSPINGRLFSPNPGLAAAHQSILGQILELTEEWEGIDSKGMHAGYTYWGQFIAHDIGARPGLVESRSSALDLDSVYGRGWGEPDILINPASGAFVLGETTATSDRPASKRDLFRRLDRTALIPEPRNEDNLIVSQFHLLILRFHNSVISKFSESGRLPTIKHRFNKTRAIVTHVFNHLTINDFLKKVISSKTFEHVIVKGNHYIDMPSGTKLPVEITNAVYRFGHSLVRDSYHLNSKATDIELSELFKMTSHGGFNGHQTLPSDRVIDWAFFFRLNSDPGPAGATRIDPIIAKGMRVVPTPNGPVDIVEKNLEAGVRSQLNSGQYCVGVLLKKFPGLKNHIDLAEGTHLEVTPEANLDLITAKGIENDTPLWIYLLLESWATSLGMKLGPLGSLLTCETIRNASENVPPLGVTPEDLGELELSEVDTFSQLIGWIEATERN